MEGYPNLKFLDPIQDLKVADMEYVQVTENIIQLEGTLKGYGCVHCPQFQNHVCSILIKIYAFHNEISAVQASSAEVRPSGKT